MNIVLYEPEMPANTGNIGRTCVATNTKLHLIEPLGFKLSEKHLVRAGLDYWDKLDVTVYSDYQDFLKRNPGAKIYMATTKGEHVYTDVPYDPDVYIMFGPESRGIPEEILVENRENCIRIPMWGDIRSLNLSNSVAIVLYEALRQNGFEKMTMEGHLHHFTLERIIEKLKNDRALIVYKIRSSSAVDFRHVFETAVEEISVL